MPISTYNYNIITNALENNELYNSPESTFTLGRKLQSGSLIFRIVSLFMQFRCLRFSTIKRWYVRRVFSVIALHKTRYLKEAENSVQDPLLHKLATPLFKTSFLTPQLLQRIKFVQQLQNKVAKIRTDLREKDYKEKRIEETIQTLYRTSSLEIDPSYPSKKKHTAKKDSPFLRSPRFRPYVTGEKQITPSEKKELQQRKEILTLFEEIQEYYKEKLNDDTLTTLRQHKAFVLNYPEDLQEEHISAYTHIQNIYDELREGDYSSNTVTIVLRILLKMTSFGVEKSSINELRDLFSLQHAPIHKVAMPHTAHGHIAVLKDSQGSTKAKIRTTTSCLGKKQKELAAYELEQCLGLNAVPPAFRAGSATNTLQSYLPHSRSLRDFLENDPQAAEKIAAIDETSMQAYLLSGLIRARGDGHAANSVLTETERGELQIHDIDEEENFLSENIYLDPDSANEGRKIPAYTKDGTPSSLTYAARMIPLGFPQARQPFSKVLLKLFSWKGFQEKALDVVQRRGIDTQALRQRLAILIETFRFEATKEAPEFSPRDLYFSFFGKDYLYHKFKQKGYTDCDFFIGAVKNSDYTLIPQCEERTSQTPYYDQNIRALDDSDYKPINYPLAQDELSPHDNLIRECATKITQYDRISLPLFSAFDTAGWNAYCDFCKKKEEIPATRMIAHFARGSDKRLIRQLVQRYRSCSFSTVESHVRKDISLVITKPPFLIQLDKNIQELKPNERISITLPKEMCNQAAWEEVLVYARTSQSINEDVLWKKIFQSLSYSTTLAWMKQLHIDTYDPKLKYHSRNTTTYNGSKNFLYTFSFILNNNQQVPVVVKTVSLEFVPQADGSMKVAFYRDLLR